MKVEPTMSLKTNNENSWIPIEPTMLFKINRLYAETHDLDEKTVGYMILKRFVLSLCVLVLS